MDETAPNHSLLGNRYQLQQTIGSGGMARVYLAKDLMLERPVAIKLLKQDLSTNPAFRKQFQLEAKAAANLSHPNIVTVHDFGFHENRIYIVMEYVPGQNLKAILKEIVRMNLADSYPLIIQACSGIGYAHRAGIIHCDIKPHNMLVTPDQRLKVTDFGIARALSSIQPHEQTNVVWGSPQYFSPEQASGLAPSPASDVYSLGVIMYEMLTGRLPFESEDANELARMHREELPVSPRQHNPEIPTALEQIILKVLSKEPAARYRTTDQLGRILETLKQQSEKNFSVIPITPVHNQAVSPVPEAQKQILPQTEQPGRCSPPEKQSNDFRENSDEKIFNIDWLTIILGLFSIIAVGSLIPFWIYIWFVLNSSQGIP